MTTPSDDFDLSAWVNDTMPGLLEAEAGEPWQVGGTEAHPAPRPVTRLTADDSPLQSFLNSPTSPPDGIGRAERAAFHEAREAAQQAAREAAMDAAEDHAHWISAQEQFRALAALNAAIDRAHEQVKRREEGSQVPVRGPEQPAEWGRW